MIKESSAKHNVSALDVYATATQIVTATIECNAKSATDNNLQFFTTLIGIQDQTT